MRTQRRRHGPCHAHAEAAARVCAALHDQLLLLDVDDGSGDAQVVSRYR